MGRRTTGQQVGLQTIGNVQANASTLTTTQTNSDLTLDPNGTGAVVVNADISLAGTMTVQNQLGLRLNELTANGTNYIAQRAAANMAGNYTITWPDSAAASSGYVLSSDTNGVLSWINPGGSISITDPGSVSTVYYPFFGTNAGALPSTLTGLNAKTTLTYVPSTGTLTTTALVGGTLTGSTANSGTLTLRSTTSVTKAAAGILIDESIASSTTATGALVVSAGVGVGGQVTTNDLFVNNTPMYPRAENLQTGSYTLALTDRNKTVTMSSASNLTVTVPPNSSVPFPIGTVINVCRIGTGSVTLAQGAGVTLTKTGNLAANEELQLRKRGTDAWAVIDQPRNASSSGGTASTTSGFNVNTFYTAGSYTLTFS